MPNVRQPCLETINRYHADIISKIARLQEMRHPEGDRFSRIYEFLSNAFHETDAIWWFLRLQSDNPHNDEIPHETMETITGAIVAFSGFVDAVFSQNVRRIGGNAMTKEMTENEKHKLTIDFEPREFQQVIREASLQSVRDALKSWEVTDKIKQAMAESIASQTLVKAVNQGMAAVDTSRIAQEIAEAVTKTLSSAVTCLIEDAMANIVLDLRGAPKYDPEKRQEALKTFREELRAIAQRADTADNPAGKASGNDEGEK